MNRHFLTDNFAEAGFLEEVQIESRRVKSGKRNYKHSNTGKSHDREPLKSCKNTCKVDRLMQNQLTGKISLISNNN